MESKLIDPFVEWLILIDSHFPAILDRNLIYDSRTIAMMVIFRHSFQMENGSFWVSNLDHPSTIIPKFWREYFLGIQLLLISSNASEWNEACWLVILIDEKNLFPFIS